MGNILWNKLDLVIFDVDGTLYDQKKLRKKMMQSLLFYYLMRPWQFKDLLILHHFRKEREKKAGYAGTNLQIEQYEWCVNKTKIPLKRVKEVVDKWIFNFPNKYLKECVYPGVEDFFKNLEDKNILKAIYSDYDSIQKLKEMGLVVDIIVSSTDQDINAMKPLPNGLNYILNSLKIEDKTRCVFIGDRMELDGKCAENAQIPFLIINKEQAKINLFKSLSNKLLNEN